jgi:hypothetical protein
VVQKGVEFQLPLDLFSSHSTSFSHCHSSLGGKEQSLWHRVEVTLVSSVFMGVNGCRRQSHDVYVLFASLLHASHLLAVAPYGSFELLLWHDVMERLSRLAPLLVSGCHRQSRDVSVLFVSLFDVSHLAVDS